MDVVSLAEELGAELGAGQLHPPSNDVALETVGRGVLGIPPDAERRWPAG